MLVQQDEEDHKVTMLERATGEVRATIHRLAEALALRTVVILKNSNKNSSRLFYLVGDWNDNNDLAVSTQVISGEPPFRHK
jgi:hypothetical protein